MRPQPKSEVAAVFVSFTIIIGAIAGVGFFYLTSSISTILNTVSQTEYNVIGNLTDHRIIANITRDNDSAKLDIIIGLLRNQIG